MSQLPVLACPFAPLATHPDAEALVARSFAWARARGLLPDETARTAAKVRSYSMLAASCYPLAPFDRLSAVCDYYSWLFFFDDACENLSLAGAPPDEVHAFLTGIYGVLHGQAAPDSRAPRYVTALADIWARIAPACPPVLRTRFIRHVINYIDGCVWEAQNRRLRTPPSRAVFQAMRMYTSTMYEFWDLIEYTGGFCLPREVVEHPLLAELARTANAVASYANDIFSMRKETGNLDFHNLVVVIKHEDQVELGEAYARAATLHDDQVRHYLALERHVPSFGAEVDHDVARYLEGMRIWMRANYEWSLVTPRYQPESADATDAAG